MLLAIAAVPLALLVVALSFPFLAVNEPSGARTAVVEGWIPQEHLHTVKDLIEQHGYERIYVTGTPRNFSYTFRMHDTVHVLLREPLMGKARMNACGSPGAGFQLMSGTDLLFADTVTGHCYDRAFTINTPIERLSITPTFNGIADPSWEVLFTLYVEVEGVNLHSLVKSMTVKRANGEDQAGLPTFADLTAETLRRTGVPAERIITLPTLDTGESRTWANARMFASRAAQDGITAVDVISFGIHARRSRVTYRTACGSGVQVGILSVADPETERGKWWRSARGWVKVIKELAGVPTSYLVKEVK